MINEQVVEIIAATGWPGMIGVYRVDIRIPADTPVGNAKLQIMAGFIKSEVVVIPIR